MTARLFDAEGHDQGFDPRDGLPGGGDARLVWIDLDLDDGASLDLVADRLGLDARDRRRIEGDTGRAALVQSPGRLHLTVEVLQSERGGDPDAAPVRKEVDLLAGPGIVVTCHRGRVDALQRFADGLADDTSLGMLDAGDLLSALVDEAITSYFELAEAFEREIDALDEAALRDRSGVDVLASIVGLRRRIGIARRTLAPHRTALAALARPEMATDELLGQPWPGLPDRIEQAIASIESLREGLLGTYDIHMGRAAQHANEVMKGLTLLSAILLPAVVLAGIMGMNFDLPFFDVAENFFLVVGAMAVFAVLLIVVARWRRWT